MYYLQSSGILIFKNVYRFGPCINKWKDTALGPDFLCLISISYPLEHTLWLTGGGEDNFTMFTRSSISSNNVSSGLESPASVQETAVGVPSYTAVVSADSLSITDMTDYTNTTTLPTVSGIVTPVSVQVFTLTIAVLPLIFLFSVILGKCLTTRNSAQTCNQHHQLHLIWNLSA